MKTFVIGDIHGNHKGLLQCLERSGFDNEIDTLISLGDVVDGHCDSFEVVEELLKIKNLIPIKGNHDDWFFEWIKTGHNPSGWMQGQKATGESYLRQQHPEDFFLYDYSTGNARVRMNNTYLPAEHISFFHMQLPYYIDEKNRLFVHGGFNRHYKLEDHDEDILWWDRDLWSQALSWQSMVGNPSPIGETYKPKFKMVDEFEEVFIGHTSTQFWGIDEPMHAANIWNLDTGGGWFGKVSIMNVDTKEYFQSDNATELYPNFKGR